MVEWELKQGRSGTISFLQKRFGTFPLKMLRTWRVEPCLQPFLGECWLQDESYFANWPIEWVVQLWTCPWWHGWHLGLCQLAMFPCIENWDLSALSCLSLPYACTCAAIVHSNATWCLNLPHKNLGCHVFFITPSPALGPHHSWTHTHSCTSCANNARYFRMCWQCTVFTCLGQLVGPFWDDWARTQITKRSNSQLLLLVLPQMVLLGLGMPCWCWVISALSNSLPPSLFCVFLQFSACLNLWALWEIIGAECLSVATKTWCQLQDGQQR